MKIRTLLSIVLPLCCGFDLKPKKILFANRHCGNHHWGIKEAGADFFKHCHQSNCIAEFDEEEYRKGRVLCR